MMTATKRKIKVKKMTLIDPDTLSALMSTAKECAAKVLRPPKTTKKKTRRGREAAARGSIPGSLLGQRAAEVMMDPLLKDLVTKDAEMSRIMEEGKSQRLHPTRIRELLGSLGRTVMKRRKELIDSGSRRATPPPPPPPPPPSPRGAEEDEFADLEDLVPKTSLLRARRLLRFIKLRGGRLTWNPSTKQLLVHGRPVAGSNVLDLAVHFSNEPRTKKRMPTPIGYDRFAEGLRDLNVPRQMVKNKRAWDSITTTTTSSNKDWLPLK